MFVSLNKKFIYAIGVFFIITSTVFLWTFYIVYNAQLQEEQKATFVRNQQFLNLLLENNNFKNKLGIKTNSSLDFSKEKKQVEELIANYDNRYNALDEGVKIICSSAILIILLILLLWFLIKRWVVDPIDHLDKLSNLVSLGDLSARLFQKNNPVFKDEFYNLGTTFNQMLENLQANIKLIKNNAVFLQSLIDNIPDGIRVIDEDYNIILANKAYYNQIGSKTKKPNKCFNDSQNFSSPCPKRLFDCPLQALQNNKASSYKIIQNFATASGKHFSINAAPLLINEFNNDKFCIVESIRDLSSDIQFSHQQKLSSLGFLATSVAHEMKNHLGAIKMILEALLDKTPEDYKTSENFKYINMIYKQIVECSCVPERLLKLTQISDSEFKPLNCSENIEEVVALLDYEAKKNGINIITTLDKKALIIGYEADFKMIIINLCLNAFKAMENGGSLSITSKVTKNNTIISIIDTGVGIQEENLNRIFEPFYSGDENNKKRSTGLGLSIVKSIVDKFKGEIRVDSTIGAGTSFELTFKRIDV